MIENNPIKILYVDDEETNLLLFSLTFRKYYKIKTATSGIEGLSIIESEPDINLVITDMKMPQMNGIEFIEKIKELKKDLPCAILSGYDITEDIEGKVKTGFLVDYIMKPLSKVQIQLLVERTIKR